MFHFFESSVIREHETMIDKTAQLWAEARGGEKSNDKCAVIFISHYHCNAETA